MRILDGARHALPRMPLSRLYTQEACRARRQPPGFNAYHALAMNIDDDGLLLWGQ